MAVKTAVEESLERLAEEKIYERVYEEVASGTKREGLWFKALSESGGEKAKAEALYVKLRVRSLIDELIVTEQIHQDEYKAQQDEYKEATRVNQKLASAKKRTASRENATEFFMGLVILLRGLASLFLCFCAFGLVYGASSGQNVLIQITVAVIFSFIAYMIWPKHLPK